MLLDIEDEAAWHMTENEDEDVGDSSNYIVAQECLDRLAIALGGNTIVPRNSRGMLKGTKYL